MWPTKLQQRAESTRRAGITWRKDIESPKAAQ
jgi:hypothetical protein